MRLVTLALLLLAAAPALAEPMREPAAPDPAVAALERLALSIQRLTLENGLRVVLNPEPSSPTLAVSVTYDVGSRNEGPGQSGFAHLFEHLMFQGSRNVKKGEHFSLVTERGGTLNGTTSADRTNYFESLPSSELGLALFLEADRMRWLSVTKENFENQRAVVQEEYRMRVANAPYATGMIRLEELVFANYPPYAHPTIGSMQDLEAAQLEWVQAFYQRHYSPQNAVLTIAGDFDPDQALAAVRQYFGTAEPRPVAPFEAPAPAPPQGGGRESVMDTNVNTPGIYWGYPIPPMRTADHYALELVTLLLADGESSRLYQKLVRERPLLQSISVWTEDRRGPDELSLVGVLTEGTQLSAVEKAFQAELSALAKKPVGAVELSRIKTRLKHHFVFGLQSNARRAIQLGEYELFFGDARLLTRELRAYLSVTAEDIQRVVATYLVPERRSVVEVRPAENARKEP